MGNTRSYDFVALSDENMHLLIGLYKKVFGRTYTIDQIKAKYQPLYTGLSAQGHFAFYKGQSIAFHGAIPMKMKYKDQIELCAQYGDAMTVKSHNGKGLFTRLGELTDKVLIDKGVRFVWGFPNQNSEYGYVNKLNWQGTERMKCYTIKLSSISSEIVSRKTKVLEKRMQEKIKKQLKNHLVEKVDLHSIDTKKYGGIDRSAAFYEYKSFSPNYFILLNGTKVWIKTVGGLLIGDLLVKSEEQVFEAVENLKKLARSIGLNKVVIQASPKSQLNQILKRKYLSTDSWLIGYKNFNSNLPLDQLQFTYGDLDTF